MSRSTTGGVAIAEDGETIRTKDEEARETARGARPSKLLRHWAGSAFLRTNVTLSRLRDVVLYDSFGPELGGLGG